MRVDKKSNNSANKASYIAPLRGILARQDQSKYNPTDDSNRISYKQNKQVAVKSVITKMYKESLLKLK